MIGHQQIVAARLRGEKPSAIFVELGLPAKPPKASGVGPAARGLHAALYDPESAMAAELSPVVYIAPDERPDLRFTRGCQVHLSGPRWSQKLIELGQALAAAGAHLVVVNAIAESPDLMIFDGEWRSV